MAGAQADRLAAMQVAANAALARQQEIFDHIDCAIVLWDAADRLVLCNREFLALYGPIADALVIGSTFEAKCYASQQAPASGA